jgi:hypothetical protein
MGVEPTITCPTCRADIKLTESLAAPLLEAERLKFEKKFALQATEVAKREKEIAAREAQIAKDKEQIDAAVEERVKQERTKLTAEAAKREHALKEREAALAKEKEEVEATVVAKLKEERAKIASEEAKKAKLALGAALDDKAKEVAELTSILKQRDEKLAEAQKAQAELIRKQRELDDAKREMDLTIERRVTESLAKTREQAKKEVEEEVSLKVIERDEKIAAMARQIEDLKRKAEQGSIQAQGEALELRLEALLSGKFPHDTITPVPKGEHGGDVLHRIMLPTGTACGTILWEFKRTKNWSDGWLAKLRDDQRQAKAEVAVIVTTVLPKGVETFDQVDGVWVVHPRCILPMAMSLRHMLIEVQCARQAGEGQQTKMEMIYHYLTGPKFRLRVQAIVEAFSSMNDDLVKEKKSIQRQWAKREEQIGRVMEATVGMYGELQGIAGKTLQEIDGLQLEDVANSAAPILPEQATRD